MNSLTLKNHQLKCEEHDYCKISLPTEYNNILEFKNHNFQNGIPFVIYADFESINKNLDVDTVINPEESVTIKRKEQKASAVGVYINSDYHKLVKSKYFSIRKKTVVDEFCDWLIETEEKFSKIFKINKIMEITDDQHFEFEIEKNCYYCNKYLGKDRVRDHDHFSGKYRGACHNLCNLAARKYKFVPIFFHNLSNYDAHLFIKALAKKPNQ